MVKQLQKLQTTPAEQGFVGAHFMDSRGDLGAEALVVKNGDIAGLGSHKELKAQFPGAVWWDARGYVLHPGFINGHTHVAMSSLREMAHVSTNMLEEVFFPLESRLTADLVESLSYPSIAMGIKSGVTCFVDHYYHAESVGRALEAFGVRAVLAETINDQGGAMPGPGRLQEAERLLSAWPFSDKITPALGPHAMDTVSDEAAKRVHSLQKQYGVPIHMHLSQTQTEMERVQSQYGMTPVERARSLGLLSPNTLAVHLVTATQKDWEILQEEGVWAGACPSSQIFYEKLMDLKTMENSGVKAVLGTDCAASHDSMDLWAELRTYHLMRRHHAGVPVNAEETLQAVWDHPAKWAGLRVGRLEVGWKADLGFTKLAWETSPVHDLRTHFVLSLSSRNLKHLMVNGEWVLWSEDLVKAPESGWAESYKKSVAKLAPQGKAKEMLFPVLD